MARKNESQNNFTAGEFSPRLYGRSDISKYNNAVETLTNAYLYPHGPALKRNGFKYIAEVKDSTKNVRLIPFQFSATDSFILEFGDTYIRFFGSQGQILDGGSPYEITTVYDETEVQSIEYAQFGNQMYLVHPNHPPQILTKIGTTDWTIEEYELLPPPTYEAGEFPSTTVTAGATTGLGVTFTAGSSVFQKADEGRQIINLSDGETGRAIITTASGTTATCDIVEDFTDTNAIASGDWKLDLSPISDLTPSGTATGSIITLDADVPDSTTAANTFRSTDVGRYVLIHGGVVQITEYTNANSVKGEVLKGLSSSDETGNWTLEDPSFTAERGYPRAVGFFEQRLWFGGTSEQPQNLWGSEVGIYDGFGTGADDDDAIDVQIVSSAASQIEWIAASRDFIVGTSGAEITVESSGGAITPSNISQRARTYFGSATQQPITIKNEVMFIPLGGRKIRTFLYDFNIDNYTADDLLFLAEHLGSGGIKEMAYAREPDSIVFAVTDAGDLLAGTYVREQEVIGWAKWTTDGTFEQVQTITVDDKDEVWVVVNRTIDGSTARYIELLDTGDGTDSIDGFSDSYLVLDNPITVTGITQASPGVVTAGTHGFSNGDTVKFFDVGGMTEVNNKTYTVANATTNTFELSGTDTTSFTAYTSGGEVHSTSTTISGLDHLEGETVQVKVDGATHPDKTVSSGSITLEDDYAKVTVGLPYTMAIKTLRKEFDLGTGTMQGQRMRWARPIVRVYQSTKPTLNGDFLPVRSGNDLMDVAVPLFTGDLEYGPTEWDSTASITLVDSNPYPLQITAIFGVIEGGTK